MFKKLIVLVLLLPMVVWSADIVEGKDYQVLTSAMAEPTRSPVVTEFFSYGCPWCYKIEPLVNGWVTKLGKTATFNRVPVVFKPDWALYAKAYYTANTLALSNKLHPLLFKTIQDEKKPLNTPQSMIDFFAANGVDREIAKSAFEHSPTITMKVQDGMKLMSQYQITGVPAFVINNKYKTDLQMAGSPEHLIEIMDFLVKKK